jgi:hypothetical protein
MPHTNGPYVTVACLCERVLTEPDGVQSAIRIVDRITSQVLSAGLASSELAPAPTVLVDLFVLIILKNGQATGSHRLQISPIAPSNLKLPSTSVDVLFEGGPDRGISFVAPVKFVAQEEGLYWFDVTLDDEPLTKMPLRIIVQRLSTTMRPGY